MEELDDLLELKEQANSPAAQDPLSDLVKLRDKALQENTASTGGQNISGYNVPFGPEHSKFDEEFRPNLFTDLEDFRSREQHWADKTARGMARVGVKVASELAKVPGYIGGAIGAIGQDNRADAMEMFVNNAWIRAIEGAEKDFNEHVIPTYVKRSVREGNLWDNISSIDFWATEGADGLGFMLAMLVPGVALGKLGLGAKMFGRLGRNPLGNSVLKATDRAAEMLGLESTAAAFDVGAATAVNTLYEAGAEAGHAMDAMEQREGESDEDFRMRRATAGRNVFFGNLAVLTVPNAILNKSVIGALSPRAAAISFKEGQAVAEIANMSLKQKIGRYGKIINNNILREGFFEEGMQTTLENHFSENEDFDAGKILEEYIDTLQSVEGQKAVFLGGLFGSTMNIIGEVRQQKADKANYANIVNAMNTGIDLYTKSKEGVFTKDGKIDFSSVSDIAEAQAQLQQRYSQLKAAEAIGDTEMVELLNSQLELELALPFIKAGQDGIKLLRGRLNEMKDLVAEGRGLDSNQTDQKIGEIVAKAEDMRREFKYFNTYGNAPIKVTKENKPYLAEFRSRLSNMFLKNRNDVKFVNERLNALRGDLGSLTSSLADVLEADETELETNEQVVGMKKDIADLESLKKDFVKQYKEMLSKKWQRGKFEEFLASRKEMEEVSKEINQDEDATQPATKEEEETQPADTPEPKVEPFTPTQASEEAEAAAAEALEEEQQNTDSTNDAKEQVNNVYNELNDIFESEMQAAKSGANQIDDKLDNVKAPTANAQALGSISGGTPIVVDENTLQYVGGISQPRIRELFPGVARAISVRFARTFDAEGRPSFTVKADGKAQPLVTQYNPDPTATEDNGDFTKEVDENLNNLDQAYTPEDNRQTMASMDAADVAAYSGRKINPYGDNQEMEEIVQRRDAKIVVSSDGRMTSTNFKDFLSFQRDKTGDQVSFEIGYVGDSKQAQEALNIYNEYQQGTRELTPGDIQMLTDYLPIRVVFGEGVYSQIFFKGTNTALSIADETIRENIINKIIKEKRDITSLHSKIAFQKSGWIQNDRVNNRPAQNNPMQLRQIDGDIEKVNMVYSDRQGQLMTPLKTPDTDFIGFYTKTKGSIFLKVKGSNGKARPLKLNVRRINESEADLIIMLTEKLLNPDIPSSFRDNISKYPEVFEFLQENFTEEMKGLGINMKDATIPQVLGNLIYEGTINKNFYQIKGQYLKYGPNRINFSEFHASKEDIKQWLVSSKNRNIRASKLSETAYKKHLLDNGILTTDATTSDYVFGKNNDVYISTNITNEGGNPFQGDSPTPSIPTAPKKTKRSKRGGPSLADALKKVDQMNKDNSSDTKC